MRDANKPKHWLPIGSDFQLDARFNEKEKELPSIGRLLKALEISKPTCIYMEAEDKGEGFEWTYLGTLCADSKRFTDYSPILSEISRTEAEKLWQGWLQK